MLAPHIFISHSSEDDAFVKDLRIALEGLGLPVWVDSRKLRGGAKLAPEIREAIEQARQIIVVLSHNTINSSWVDREVQFALSLENCGRWRKWLHFLPNRRRDCRIIPLLLPAAVNCNGPSSATSPTATPPNPGQPGPISTTWNSSPATRKPPPRPGSRPFKAFSPIVGMEERTIMLVGNGA